MVEKTQINFLLISLNIVVLSYFVYPPPSWTLLIYLALVQLNIVDDLRRKMQIISVISLGASFIFVPWLTDFFSAVALGLSMNVGYRIDLHAAPCIINCCLAFGIVLGSLTASQVLKYQTARDMAILVCTLPNLFMAKDLTQKKQNSTLWFFCPFFDKAMTYSIGFIVGVFLPLTSINKHTRFLIISLILLMTIFVQGTVYQDILSLLRGFFIYDQTRHSAELYFIVGYILVDIVASSYKFNYLFVGYLVISVILWHKQDFRPDYRQRQRKSLQKPLLVELAPIQKQQQPQQQLYTD